MTFAFSQLKIEWVISSIVTNAVPKNTVKKDRFSTITLIDCIAATPCSSGSRASAFITNEEKAKNTPATKPEPIAPIKITYGINWSIKSHHPTHYRSSPYFEYFYSSLKKGIVPSLTAPLNPYKEPFFLKNGHYSLIENIRNFFVVAYNKKTFYYCKAPYSRRTLCKMKEPLMIKKSILMLKKESSY